MRTIVGVTVAISTLLIGVLAISQQGQQAESTTDTSATNASYETATGVLEGVTHGGGEAIIWFGVAAIILAACGLLVAAATGGGR